MVFNNFKWVIKSYKQDQYDVAINLVNMFVKSIVDNIGKFITEQLLHMEVMKLFLFHGNTDINWTKYQVNRVNISSWEPEFLTMPGTQKF